MLIGATERMMKMKKTFMAFFVVFLMTVFAGEANASWNADEYGCYYWSGDENYLAIAQEQIHIIAVKLDTCRYDTYNGREVVYGTTVTFWMGDSASVQQPAYFFPDGSFKYAFGGGYGRVSVGNIRNVVATIYEAAS